MSWPPRSMSKPASRSARILSSSRALVSTNSSMSGWSTSSTTIFAARRVAPPDLMVPADASAPRMKRHRAAGGAAGGQQLLGRPDPGQVQAGAGAALEDQPLLAVPVQDRVHRVVDGEDEAGRDLLRGVGPDVEPDRRVEREHLVQQHPGQLVLEDLGVGVGGEVAVLLAGRRVGQHDPVDELPQAPLARVGADGAAEVLGGDDGGGVDRPEVGELDAALLEDGLARPPVGHDDVAALPGHLVVGVHARRWCRSARARRPPSGRRTTLGLVAGLGAVHRLRHVPAVSFVPRVVQRPGGVPGFLPARVVQVRRPTVAATSRSALRRAISASKSAIDSKPR